MTNEPVELTIIQTFEEGKDKQPLKKGFRPSFHALWHLKALGVITDLATFVGAWDSIDPKPGTEVKIAVIDTPVAYDHPNLRGSIDLALMRDFSVHDDGAFLVPTESGHILTRRQELCNELKAWGGTASAKKAITSETKGTDKRPPCAPRPNGAHGTAVAGLIGARPANVTLRKPSFRTNANQDYDASISTDLAARDDTIPLPYVGINPFCRIIPISTTASPDPGMVLAALQYAMLIKPDIVVIAAAWEDQRFRNGRWNAVNKAVLDLGKTAIVLCAAGNSGNTELAYPACLSAAGGSVLAVTACDGKGKVLSYAPDPQDNDNVIRTLSSWTESYTTDGIIIDPWKAIDPMVVQPSRDPVNKKGVANIPAVSLITLDVPGPYGYNPSPYRYRPPVDGPHFDIGSLYCHFSGTSAATAVAAGLISLAIQEYWQKFGIPTKQPKPLKPGKDLFDYPVAWNLVSLSRE
ncbi:MAG: S8 family serine peptidase [Rhodobacterales bacterium]|nr:S8 family serine peptidase [Rhodobacterales bacterium]